MEDLYAVELDALPALIPDEFKKLVIQSVEHFMIRKFTQKLYQSTLC